MKKPGTLTSALITVLFCIYGMTASFSQKTDSAKVSLDVNADLVSSYIWRGALADPAPNIQPTVSLKAGNFELGLWGSSNFTGTYHEVDLYASYTFKSFTLTLNDYCWPPFIDSVNYFDYRSDRTGHFFEGSLAWEGPEKFPLKLLAATIFYGPDKKIDRASESDTTFRNNYSTYFEAAWPFTVGETEFCPFAGITPTSGYYADSFSVVNLGINISRVLKVSEKFEFPVYGSLITNPQSQQVFFVLGMTFIP